MEEELDRLKESAINLIHIAHAVLEYDMSYSGVKAHFILHSIYKQNKNSNEIIKPLPRL